MGKGGYLGGSTIVGFSGSDLKTRRRKLTQPIEIDSHLTQTRSARGIARAVKTAEDKLKWLREGAQLEADIRAEIEARRRLRNSLENDAVVKHCAGDATLSIRKT